MKKRIRKSVFSRLIIIYLTTLCLLISGLILFRQSSSSTRNYSISSLNLALFSELLTDSIGTPPDLEKAEKIYYDSGLEITITGPGVHWSTHDEEEEFSGLFLYLHDLVDYSVHIERGKFSYQYRDYHSDIRITLFNTFILGIFLIFSIGFSYISVRQLLKPLRKMTETALEFGVDHWKHRVTPRGDDELAILGREMDRMADRIEQYIDSIHALIRAVSHEYRSPLTRMKVALEFMENQELKQSLIEEIDSLNSLTEKLLEQSRLRTQPGLLIKKEFNPTEWLENFCKSYNTRQLPVTFRSTCDSPFPAFMDKERLELAMRSIVENALRHAPGSDIDITLSRQQKEFLIEVSDNGPGIPDDLIHRLGEPFLLADSSRSGTRIEGGFGLGFSIVKTITEAHKGKMEVTNLSPSGTRVILRFPVICE